MTCRNCGTTENVGEDGLCGDCAEDEELADELDESFDDEIEEPDDDDSMLYWL
jgi:NMD protein affecting ribosome stability and mRNA decay